MLTRGGTGILPVLDCRKWSHARALATRQCHPSGDSASASSGKACAWDRFNWVCALVCGTWKRLIGYDRSSDTVAEANRVVCNAARCPARHQGGTLWISLATMRIGTTRAVAGSWG